MRLAFLLLPIIIIMLGLCLSLSLYPSDWLTDSTEPDEQPDLTY